MQMDYTRGAEQPLIVRRSYDYDTLGRPTARELARYGTQTLDTFGYNTRSELTSARVNSADYSYSYDAIGNRAAATEAGAQTAYSANALNQYTAEGSFTPTYDADGNQTRVKTSTGIWSVTYNAKNRPIRFESADGSIAVECTYDTMGRRATKKVTTNGTLTEHRRFLYRGYLQIAACDLTRANTPALWYILWDPTQPTATRPLAIQKNGTWYTYGWDLTKNICETYRPDGRIDIAYTYSPYGAVSPAHTYDQPIRWSSEYHDTELGLTYYNYRHYNPTSGRWMGRDLEDETSNLNLLGFVYNKPIYMMDSLGLSFFSQNQNGNAENECCSQKRPKHVYIGATERKNSAILIPNPTTESLIETITQSVKKCECISELQIIAHGNKDLFSVDSYYNGLSGEKKKPRQMVDTQKAKEVFSRIKIVMCSECIIFMDSCHLGLGEIPQIIANETKCKVRAALGFCTPQATFPRLSKSRTKAKNYPILYKKEAQDEFKYFTPSIEKKQ